MHVYVHTYRRTYFQSGSAARPAERLSYRFTAKGWASCLYNHEWRNNTYDASHEHGLNMDIIGNSMHIMEAPRKIIVKTNSYNFTCTYTYKNA